MNETKHCLSVLSICALAAWGCATDGVHRATHEQRPLEGSVSRNAPSPDGTRPSDAERTAPVTAADETTTPITLRDALARALRDSPQLAAFSWEVRAREAAALQAGLLPNPELSIELENFGGSGEFGGFDASENTVRLAQLIELGGKRTKRRAVALRERELAGWDYEAARIDTLTRVALAFVDVLAAQERLALTQQLVAAGEKALAVVDDQVEAGAVSAVEHSRADVALASAGVDLHRRRRELETARVWLAATWGGADAIFSRAEGRLDDGIVEPPSVAALLARLSENPDLARWSTQLSAHREAVDLEEAKRVPDVTLGGGPRWFNDTDDSAFVVDLSVPLPLFDRNQGGLLEAHHRLAKANAEHAAAEIDVRATLVVAHRSLAAAYDTVATLRERVLPKAEEAYAGATSAYRRGVLRYLDVLDTQRTLFALRSEYLDALAEYHGAVARVERLVGQSLEEIRDAQKGS